MNDQTTVIRVMKTSRRILRTIAMLKNRTMQDVFDEIVLDAGTKEENNNPSLWKEFFSRTADEGKAE